jgi:hypothetical protein
MDDDNDEVINDKSTSVVLKAWRIVESVLHQKSIAK